MRRLLTIVSLLVFVGVLTACHSKPDDEIIAKNIQTKISANPSTQDSQVAVLSNEGKVTLRGTTKTKEAKQEIAEMAKEEPGVSAVDDETSVLGQHTTSSSSSAPNAGRFTPPPAPPPPPPIVVPAGTILTVRTNQALSTKSVQTGATFTGSVMTPITLDGKMVIPAGSDVIGTVTDAKKAGKFKGGASLTLVLNSVTVNGHTYNIVTEFFGQETKGKGKRTAGMITGGAGAGAAIGAVAGCGTGAAIGAIAGAAGGTVVAMTGTRDIQLPAESALNFKLDQPLTLKPDSGT